MFWNNIIFCNHDKCLLLMLNNEKSNDYYGEFSKRYPIYINKMSVLNLGSSNQETITAPSSYMEVILLVIFMSTN